MKNLLVLLFFFSMIACQKNTPDDADKKGFSQKVAVINNDFNDYWYAGKGEITSYDLQQSRYGEIHSGKGTFIFVTEPFSKNKQVKLDYPDANSKDNVSVLKLNATRKFNTGIYPYSTIQSVFTPIKLKEHPNTLKISTSSQEWCGHTFEQLNLKSNHYDHQLFSYFESEGDISNKLEKTWLEDELFSRIRIQPENLPTGDLKIIPGTLFSRFRHLPLKTEKANASLKKGVNDGEMTYQITYSEIGRTLTINFQKEFPFIIESWEEMDHKNPNLITRATRIKTLRLAYWNNHDVVDLKYRKELGLE